MCEFCEGCVSFEVWVGFGGEFYLFGARWGRGVEWAGWWAVWTYSGRDESYGAGGCEERAAEGVGMRHCWVNWVMVRYTRRR